MAVFIEKFTKLDLNVLVCLFVYSGLPLNPLFAEDTKPWAADLSAGVSSSLYRFNQESRTVDFEVLAEPSYKIQENLVLGLNGGITQSRDADHLHRTFLNDGRLFLTHSGPRLSQVFKLSEAISFAIPISEKSYKIDSLITGVTLGPNLKADFSSIGLKNFFTTYRLRGTKNFHRYTVSTEGNSNKEYNLSNRIDLEYSPINKLGLRGTFIYGNGWSYAGNATGNFSLEQAISYEINNRMGLEIGHSNGGDALSANGQDSNIAFINENASQIYGALSYRL